MKNYRLSISSTYNGPFNEFISHFEAVEPLFASFAKTFKLDINTYTKKDGAYFDLTDSMAEGVAKFKIIAVFDFISDKTTANRIRKALFYFMLINSFKEEENVKFPFN